MRRLRILTWHVHGSYLYYLTQAPHDFYLPVKPDRPEGYGGRLPGFPWGDNVHDVAADEVRHLPFDCVLFQSRRNYLQDQYEILSPEQRQLPHLFLEHDPPREHPTDTTHVVNDPNMFLVHVTHFNDLMWDSGETPTYVIDHGVIVPNNVTYTGEIPRGIVVVNGLRSRGRRLGSDIFEKVRRQVPIDLVGMGSEALGGLGEISHEELPGFLSRYRFFFHPIRYTSLGLSVCEAMMLGLPIVGLATTELPTVVENGVSGYVSTDLQWLIQQMQILIDDPAQALFLSHNAQQYAQQRFSIQRFVRDWNDVLELAIARHSPVYETV
ncbi:MULTISPECIES: glycosyltransferase family 4 protein [unclassified Leptolyngbya]|uniref:glycosyltransferase n=1 Tax=unclassified Leptolyngbya TaxID=2650499 RepID=UPI001688C33B|nr:MULTISPECIES: glycosyltransferase family 4 protein [unclassified Leptolyngbya]MBD1909209.1 glycosyltransferase family 4 protein [Leptolyngbya sp. FACHB-8]MBD2153988.1 glycosyltransferase family 4 protein [Leptolyngbya sp. FACHB-16]